MSTFPTRPLPTTAGTSTSPVARSSRNASEWQLAQMDALSSLWTMLSPGTSPALRPTGRAPWASTPGAFPTRESTSGTHSAARSSGMVTCLEAALRGSDNVMPGDGTRKPGPGAHSPEKVVVNKKKYPSFSLGIRHSEFVCPLIIDVTD